MVHLLPQASAHSSIAACGLVSCYYQTPPIAEYVQISAIASLALLFHMLIASFHDSRGYSMNASRTKAANFTTSQSGIFLINLLIADLVQGLGFALSMHWAIVGDTFDFHHAPMMSVFPIRRNIRLTNR